MGRRISYGYVGRGLLRSIMRLVLSLRGRRRSRRRLEDSLRLAVLAARASELRLEAARNGRRRLRWRDL